MEEEFRKIDWGHGNYVVSDLGTIRNEDTGKMLKSYINTYGYRCVSMHCAANKRIVLVHRMVAEMFVLERDGPEVIHLDCDKLNNVPGNLKWCTKREGMLHYWRHKCENIRKSNLAIELEIINGQ